MFESYKNLPEVNAKTAESLCVKFNINIAYLSGKDVHVVSMFEVAPEVAIVYLRS